MKIIHRALLKFTDQDKKLLDTKQLSLFQVEANVFRWITDGPGTPFDGVDYLRMEDAIKGLRVLVQSDPAYVGCDLTVLPVDLPPDERAAKRIIMEMFSDYVPPESIPYEIERVAGVIDEECQSTAMIEAVNLLMAYEIPRLRAPKPGGLDMAHGGLIVTILEVIEKAQKVDLTNLKKKLTEGVEQIKVYSSIPGSKVVN